MYVFIGTYTESLTHVNGQAEGIYTYRLDSTTGALTFTGQMAHTTNPSFIVVDAAARYLYAVNEAAAPHSVICAYAIDAESGALTLLNQQPSHGAAACYLSLDHSGRTLFVANYGDGVIASYPLLADGRIGAAASVSQHQGSSVNPARQEAAHTHSIVPAPDNRFVFVADLGLDQVVAYQFEAGTSRLTPRPDLTVAVTPGAGPRHFTFHPGGRYAALVNELNSTVNLYRYTEGRLSLLQTVSTLPEDFTDENLTAEIQWDGSGRFLYVSNRGHNSLAIFTFNEAEEQLTLVGHEPTQGQFPRHFALDPTGTFLLAANQDSNTIISYRSDSQSGRLSPTGYIASVPTPVCLRIIPWNEQPQSSD